MVATGRPMVLSLALWGQNYLLPCTNETAPFLKCDPNGNQCKPCPLAPIFADVGCCIEQARFGTNMHGEFAANQPGEPLVPSGGHSLLLVGYSDAYVSPATGQVGALIIKNSWWDCVPPVGMVCTDPTAPCAAGRGSHSVAFLKQQISDIAERDVCPNVHSPASWYQCADHKACTDPATAMFARAMRKVLRLECFDASPFVTGVCTPGDKFFLQKITACGAGLSVACFVRADGGHDLCLPPLWAEDLAMLFKPVEEESRENDPDLCGFYTVSYEIFGQVAATLGNTYASDFDIRWAESAYVRAPASKRLPAVDYAMIEKDTVKQEERRFTGPFPDLVDVWPAMKLEI